MTLLLPPIQRSPSSGPPSAVLSPMPSNSFLRWRGQRARALNELENAHARVEGTDRGRRYATQQINPAYAVLLTAQFQGFCRDLHDECIDKLRTVRHTERFEADTLEYHLQRGTATGTIAVPIRNRYCLERIRTKQSCCQSRVTAKFRRQAKLAMAGEAATRTAKTPTSGPRAGRRWAFWLLLDTNAHDGRAGLTVVDLLVARARPPEASAGER